MRLGQIDRLGAPSEEEGSALYADLRGLLRDTLHALSRGDLRRPERVARALAPLGWFVEKYLPEADFSPADV
ncbi:MAG: hypothetical protein R3B70_10845, partial [Polyangiaceae bacterium]